MKRLQNKTHAEVRSLRRAVARQSKELKGRSEADNEEAVSKDLTAYRRTKNVAIANGRNQSKTNKRKAKDGQKQRKRAKKDRDEDEFGEDSTASSYFQDLVGCQKKNGKIKLFAKWSPKGNITLEPIEQVYYDVPHLVEILGKKKPAVAEWLEENRVTVAGKASKSTTGVAGMAPEEASEATTEVAGTEASKLGAKLAGTEATPQEATEASKSTGVAGMAPEEASKATTKVAETEATPQEAMTEVAGTVPEKATGAMTEVAETEATPQEATTEVAGTVPEEPTGATIEVAETVPEEPTGATIEVAKTAPEEPMGTRLTRRRSTRGANSETHVECDHKDPSKYQIEIDHRYCVAGCYLSGLACSCGLRMVAKEDDDDTFKPSPKRPAWVCENFKAGGKCMCVLCHKCFEALLEDERASGRRRDVALI